YGNSYFAATDPGFPGIKMTTTGVTDLMQNRIGDNGIFFHSACESNSSIDNWFNPAPPYVTNVGPTMLAYDSNCSIYLGCRELSLFAKVLGCQVLGIDPDTYSAYLLTKNLHAGVLLHHGNIYNRLNPHIDCLNPRTNVLAVDLNHGSATWVAAMDRADTIYEVYWRDHNGSLISQMNVPEGVNKSETLSSFDLLNK